MRSCHCKLTVAERNCLQSGSFIKGNSLIGACSRLVLMCTFYYVLLCLLSRALLFHVQTLFMGQWKTFLLFRDVSVLSLAPWLLSAVIILYFCSPLYYSEHSNSFEPWLDLLSWLGNAGFFSNPHCINLQASILLFIHMTSLVQRCMHKEYICVHTHLCMQTTKTCVTTISNHFI